MASIPVPRSYSAIVGEIVNATLARLGLPSLKEGSPALCIIEACAQSDLRSSQDLFNLLNSISLDRATGIALDRIGADENLPRISEAPATGVVTVSDTSFTKKSSRIYQGLQAPIIGTQNLIVEDAATWTTTGSVYIGRGTTNYEGPLAYDVKTNFGTYWQIHLTSGTTRFHNLGEPVTLAQGGNRSIPAGTLVQTPQGNASTAATFSTQYAATIPDGEVTVVGIPAICRVPGVSGNVPASSVISFVSPPFTGAAVVNPAPFTNGVGTEDDESYRDRIRAARSSRSKGTAIALKSGVLGITALDENKRVLSASVVSRESEPVSLYIDDGTGYEERSSGIAYEVLAEGGQGGEQYFQLVHGRPATKAYLETVLTAPFSLAADQQLAFEVGSVRTTHIFPATDFRSINTASAYEVVASINSDPGLDWVARTTDSGTRVAVFAKADSNEYLQATTPPTGFTDANPFLGFSAGLQQTLWLYRNDVLLSKDGRLAEIQTLPQGLWDGMSGGQSLSLEVDGITLSFDGISLPEFTDQDFIDAGTGYVSLSASNSLAAWATVFNYRIPGITATVDGTVLTLTSNLGRNSRASVVITGGVLLSKMFSGVVTEGRGVSRDYTLDRNLGQIRLEEPLAAGDRLTASSRYTRGFVETSSFTSLTVPAEQTSVSGESGAELWFVVDGAAQVLNTGISSGALVTIANTPSAPGTRVRYSVPTTGAFLGVRRGDWMVVTDTALGIAHRGAFRIADIDESTSKYLDIDRPSSTYGQSSTSLAFGGLSVVRTTAVPQRAYVPATGSPYTATSLATALNLYLKGATAGAYRNRSTRVRTNTYGTSGDLAFVAGNSGAALMFISGDALLSGASHRATVMAGHPEAGTPGFVTRTVSASTGKTNLSLNSVAGFDPGSILVALRPSGLTGTYPQNLHWSNWNHTSALELIQTLTLTARNPVLQHWLPASDRCYPASSYGLTARDQVGFTLDGDDVSGRFVINTYRKVTPSNGTYSDVNEFKDADNGGLSLAQAFGSSFDWKDFAVHMKARWKLDGDTPGSGIVWRYYRHGPEGNLANISIRYPLAPLAAVAVSSDSRSSDRLDVRVRLPGGAAYPIPGLRNSSYIAINPISSGPSGTTVQTVFNLPVAYATRYTRLNTTGTASVGGWTGGWPGGGALVTSSGGATGILVSARSGQTAPVLELYSVTGTFNNGETLTSSGGGTGLTVSGSAYGNTVIIQLSLPSPMTGSGLGAGDVVWFQSTSGSFVTGNRTLSASYPNYYVMEVGDSAATTGVISNPGTISRDIGGEVTLAGCSAIVGDLLNLSAVPGVPAYIQDESPGNILTKDNSKATFKVPVSGVTIPGSPQLIWYPINNTANVTAYPLAAARTLTDIVTAINAISGSPVTGATYGTPTTTISLSTPDTTPYYFWYDLIDGINWVKTHTNPSPSTDQVSFTFKAAATVGLNLNSDWAQEDVRLVPTTAKNITDWLGSSAVGGLFSRSEISLSQRGGRPEITTTTDGGAGGISITGGTANSLTATVVGSAVNTGTYITVAVDDSEADGLGGQQWVSLDNQSPGPKTIFYPDTELLEITWDGVVEVDSATTAVWRYSGSDIYANGGWDGAEGINRTWQVERQGDFVAFSWREGSGAVPAGLSNVQEGDWVVISSSGAGAVPNLSDLNLGTFRVVRMESSTATFWIENPSAVEEEGRCTVEFLDFNSVMPGDKLVIGTSFWGAGNVGTWTVGGRWPSSFWAFTLNTADRATEPVSLSPGSLGSLYNQIQVLEAKPGRFIKRLLAISPNGSLADLKLSTSRGYELIGNTYGTVIRPLDKLAFGINTLTGEVQTQAPGVDGYRHNTGLIAEVNRVVYGDERDTSGYPGIAAAGAQVNINGPLVRRISVGLSLRVKTGISTVDIESKVKSGVAAVVNRTPVGTSVSISDIISSAQSVNGVVAVVVLSPAYGSGNDLISVQPYEKAMIVDSNKDVLVSFVGEQ